MATKKTEETTKEAVTEETEKRPEKKGEKLVTIRLPRERKDQGDLFVSVNERTWLIKRGVDVEVPECVKEVIDNANRQRDAALDYILGASND